MNPTKPGHDRPGPTPPPPYRSSPNQTSSILMITLSPASPIQTLDQNKGRCPSRTFPQSRFADPSHPEVLSEPPGWVQTDPAITPSDPYPPHQSGRDDLAPPLSDYPRGRAPARKLLCPVSTDTRLPHRKHPRQKRTIPAHQHATRARAFPITHTSPGGRRPPDKYSRDEYLFVAACLRLFRQTHSPTTNRYRFQPVGKRPPQSTPKAATI